MIVYGSCVGSVVVQLGVASCGVVQWWFSNCAQLCVVWLFMVQLWLGVHSALVKVCGLSV